MLDKPFTPFLLVSLSLALGFTAPVLFLGRAGNLPLLLPVWAAALYGLLRTGRGLPWLALIAAQLVFGAVALTMFFGPGQVDPLLNRLGHALVASVLAAILCLECGRLAGLRLACLFGFSLAVTLGVGMELTEALVSTRGTVTAERFHDTIADLAANLSGAGAGALGSAAFMRLRPGHSPSPSFAANHHP